MKGGPDGNTSQLRVRSRQVPADRTADRSPNRAVSPGRRLRLRWSRRRVSDDVERRGAARSDRARALARGEDDGPVAARPAARPGELRPRARDAANRPRGVRVGCRERRARSRREVGGMTLEEELAHLLTAARLDIRQARAVRRRLGWDGHGPTTLAAAGGAEGYTREGVRQLEGRLRRHVERHAPALPLTAAALRTVENAAPAARTDLARLLAAEGIAERPFDPAGVLLAAE